MTPTRLLQLLLGASFALAGSHAASTATSTISIIAASSSPFFGLAASGNSVRQLYGVYKHLANEDVERATQKVYATIDETNAEVRRLYALAEDRLLRTINKAARLLGAEKDATKAAEAQHLASVEVPVYIKRVNVAVDQAVLKIARSVDETIAEIRQIFHQAEVDIAAAVAATDSGELVVPSVAQIVGKAVGDVEEAVAKGQRSVQRHFFWANLIVQAYIALTEKRVAKLLPAAVSKQVNADLAQSAEEIDRVEKKAFAKVVDTMLEVREAFERLREFLED